VLLGVLPAAFAPTGPLLFGSDETLEHRRDERIATNDHHPTGGGGQAGAVLQHPPPESQG
jgi:hypothetical protein